MDKYRYKGRLKIADMQSVLISLWGFDDTFCTYSGIFILVLEFFVLKQNQKSSMSSDSDKP